METLFGRDRRAIFRYVHIAPLTVFDPGPDLRRGLSFVRLFVGVEPLPYANFANGCVLSCKTIEQAAMPLAAIAMTIAGLLVKDFLHASGEVISVLHDDVGELRGIERLRKLALGRFIVECRHRLFGALRLA